MTSPTILTGRLFALQRDGEKYEAAFYQQNGTSAKPVWRQISPEAYGALVIKFSDYLTWLDTLGPYEYRSYSVWGQVEADWGRDLAEYRDLQQTQDALARENA